MAVRGTTLDDAWSSEGLLPAGDTKQITPPTQPGAQQDTKDEMPVFMAQAAASTILTPQQADDDCESCPMIGTIAISVLTGVIVGMLLANMLASKHTETQTARMNEMLIAIIRGQTLGGQTLRGQT